MNRFALFFPRTSNDPFIELGISSLESLINLGCLHIYDDFSLKDTYHLNFINYVNTEFKFVFVAWFDVNEKTLEQSTINLINKTPNIFLLIWHCYEPYVDLKSVKKFINDSQIRNSKVIVLSTDSTIDTTLNSVILDEWFEALSRYQIKLYNDASFINPCEYFIPKNYRGLCLNRNVRPHRIWNYYALFNSNLLPKLYFSYHLPIIHDNQKKYQSVPPFVYKDVIEEAKLALPSKIQKKFSKWKNLYTPRYLDNHEVTPYFYDNSIKKYYKASAYSIVTETVTDKLFVTEKTYKAIAHCHPFISVSSKENINYLVSHGYKLYEELFNGVTCIDNYETAIQVYKHLANKSENLWKAQLNEARTIAVHNYHNFFERPILFATVINTIINKINKQNFSD